jgi:hypothetical protein
MFTVVLSTSIPDYTDMPCTLTQRALLELALAQQDMTGKHSSEFSCNFVKSTMFCFV